MTTKRFDQDPDSIYGRCLTCGEEQATEADSKHHMSETHEEARKNGGTKGHTISISNPSRTYRVSAHTSSVVDEALDGAMRDMQRLVDNDDATVDEIRDSLWMHGDFQEAWDDWNAEEGEES